MLVPRTGAGSSSDYDRWIVTGGLGYQDDERLTSTEIFTGGSWTQGPPLPWHMEYHCQIRIKIENRFRIIIIGDNILFHLEYIKNFNNRWK